MILQMEAVECGAASLAMILAYHGKWLPLERVRIDCGVSRDGSSAAGIIRAAKGYGLEASAYKVEPDLLEDMTPCIIHWDFKHFVVFRGFKHGKAYLNDPGIGPVKVPMEEFNKYFTGVALEFEKTDSFKADGSPVSMKSYIQRQLKEAKEAIILTLLFGIFSAFINVSSPLLTQVFTDNILNGEHTEWLKIVLLLLSALSVFAFIQTYLNKKYSMRIMGNLALHANSRFLNHVLRLPMEFFGQRSAGDLSQRQTLNRDITSTLVNTTVPLAVNVGLVIIYLILMMLYSAKLAIVGILTAMLNVSVLMILAEFRINQNRTLQQNQAKYYGATVSCIDNIESIKAAGAENGFFVYWNGLYTHLFNTKQKINRQNAYLGILPIILNTLSSAVVLVLGAKYILDGELSIGMLLAFQGYLSAFMVPVNNIITNSQTVIAMRSEIERTEDVMRYKEDKIYSYSKENNTKDTSTTGKLIGDVELKNITFGYNPFSEPLIRDFSMHIKPGGMVAFVGASGCGKSTLAKIISGLYKPWKGEVLFDGKSIKDIDRDEFTNSVAVIDQNVVLFEDSVAQNIKMWDPSIEDFAMILAANDAQIRRDIVSRPTGFDTKILKGGLNFSGGQRQRIEIATALAKEPTVIIMDEATSALDPSTEKMVMKSIRDSGTTLIVIAHRLSTIRDADEIIVLDNGIVQQRGTHESLINTEGIYRTLMQSI